LLEVDVRCSRKSYKNLKRKQLENHKSLSSMFEEKFVSNLFKKHEKEKSNNTLICLKNENTKN
jgi:hypothetical protein